MNDEILFSEKQRFRQWWLWVIILGVDGIFVLGIIKQVIGGEQFGGKPASNPQLIIGFVFLLLLTGLFLIFRLETLIKEDGIYYRFFPIQIAFRKQGWGALSKLYVREYSALGEYGGWDFRRGMSGSGNALNVSGSMGLQLVFINNKRLLIGTNKAEELTEVLRKLGKPGE